MARRHAILWLAFAGCYEPTPPEGAPCSMSAECPGSLRCFDGRCRAEAPDVDAAPADPDRPPIDAAPATGCPTFALQCDDFEGAGLADWRIRISDPAGSVGVSDEIAFSGTRSVDTLVRERMLSGASAYVARDVDARTGVLAMRAWVFAPGPVVDFSGVVIFERDGGYALVSGDNDQRWTVTEQSSAGLFDHHSTVAAVPNRWTCVELNYQLEPRRIQLFVDGAMIIDTTPNDPAPTFALAGAGVTRSPAPGFRLFVDDVVVATQHIGCD